VAGVADVAVDQVHVGGIGDQVAGGRPGRGDQAGEDAQVDEEPRWCGGRADAGGGGRSVRVEHVQQPLLKVQELFLVVIVRRVGADGTVESVRAGRRPSLSGWGERVAAGGGVQAGIGWQWQELGACGSAVVDRVAAGRAGVVEEPPVGGAGEYDGQPPELAEGAAVALLDEAAVAGQAVGAVAG